MTEPIVASAGFTAIIILIIVAIFALSIFLTIFWVLMLVDAAKRNFKEENEKVVWIVIIAITSWIGAIIYYFMIKHKDKRKNNH